MFASLLFDRGELAHWFLENVNNAIDVVECDVVCNNTCNAPGREGCNDCIDGFKYANSSSGCVGKQPYNLR